MKRLIEQLRIRTAGTGKEKRPKVMLIAAVAVLAVVFDRRDVALCG